MRFNQLPIKHQLGWVENASLIYEDMTTPKFFKLLQKHNPRVIVYANGECSSWETDFDRVKFMYEAGIKIKHP